jgi:hypothetical protein
MSVMEQERRLIRYLLGELSKAERVEIEDSYLADSEAFDQLLIAEDQLIDDYVREHLSAKDRQLFEKNFLSSAERRTRLGSARALLAFADKHSEAAAQRPESVWKRLRRFFDIETPFPRLVLATGFLIALVGGPLALWRISNLSAELESLRENQIAQNEKARELQEALTRQNESFKEDLAVERRERGRLEQEFETVKEGVSAPSQSTPPPVVFALGTGYSDGFPRGNEPDLAIPQNAQRVQLRFQVPGKDSHSYLVVVTDDQSNEIWRGDVRVKSGAIRLTLAARLFQTGSYRAIVTDSDAAVNFEQYFAFRIEKK